MRLQIIFGFAATIVCWTLFSCRSNPYSDGGVSLPPDPSRFVIEDLVQNLDEPMELDFLPDGRILFIERKGILKLHNPLTGITQVAGHIAVHYINENGLLGMALDPNFMDNQWIYLFYTDPVRKDYQHVSRFEFKNDSLWTQTEKKLLDFYIDVHHCCHFGGCLAFGPNGNLFISSGDNVGGTDYAPIDERPGNHLQDAQRTSANSNDLRGSILRIKPEADGTYSIPKGNLFPVDSPNTRPEIYVMGARNPLKITVDQEKGWLYWGDVGPNPGWKYKDWGPGSQEEINQAQKAGNFGWPYMLGDNQAYRDRDFSTDSVGAFFDPDHLINDSPNNTGILQLPPAQKALIWFPNTASDSFPLVGTGGGTVCAGPVYHYQDSLDSPIKWPAYFDDRLFIYEWMRSWVLAVQLDESGAYQGMEQIFEANPFKKPIDIEFGPDGAMYVLDYGSNWYAQNPDARLTRIAYQRGNRAPIARFKTSISKGASPLEVHFSAKESYDPDPKDVLTYAWYFNEDHIQSHEAESSFKFIENGDYIVRLVVTDAEGLSHESRQLIQVGNATPEIKGLLSPNSTLYKAGQSIDLIVAVNDLEDGTTQDGSISGDSVQIHQFSIPLSPYVRNIRNLSQWNKASIQHVQGKILMESSDCLACHSYDQQSVGPSYTSIAQKYASEPHAINHLSQKVQLGGKGVWGDFYMPAHPQHTDEEIRSMLGFILAINSKEQESQKLPLQHQIDTKKLPQDHMILLTASYRDQGGKNQPPIHQEWRRILRPNILPAIAFDTAFRVSPKPIEGSNEYYAEVALNGCFVGFDKMDLREISQIKIKMRTNAAFIQVDLHKDQTDGPLISSKRMVLVEKEDKWAPYTEEEWFYLELPINPEKNIDQSDLYFVFYSDKAESDYIYFDICQLHSFEFEFSSSEIE